MKTVYSKLTAKKFLVSMTYVHTNLYSAKNCENESEVLAQDD